MADCAKSIDKIDSANCKVSLLIDFLNSSDRKLELTEDGVCGLMELLCDISADIQSAKTIITNLDGTVKEIVSQE
jgi:hypothetical protein